MPQTPEFRKTQEFEGELTNRRVGDADIDAILADPERLQELLQTPFEQRELTHDELLDLLHGMLERAK